MDRLTWDEYYMSIAKVAAMRSKDPHTQVGAVLVGDNNRIISTGYNGFPYMCNDELLPLERDGNWLDTKYPYTVHAEVNAILNTNGMNLKGSTLYVTLYPCNECAKVILQAGVKRVIYLENKYPNDNAFVASYKLFKNANIECEQFKQSGKTFSISI